MYNSIYFFANLFIYIIIGLIRYEKTGKFEGIINGGWRKKEDEEKWKNNYFVHIGDIFHLLIYIVFPIFWFGNM